MKYNYKRNIKLIGGTIAGSTLGFIHANTQGAIAGGTIAYHILDKTLDKDGNLF